MQIAYYDQTIMQPFIEGQLGLKFDAVQSEALKYVAQFFGMTQSFEAPEQGDILSRGLRESTGEPEMCCIQEYLGLQTFNQHTAPFVELIVQQRLQQNK